MARQRLSIRVAGQWLSAIGPWSGLKFSTLADGGCGEASWQMLLPHNTVGGSVLKRGAIVEILAAATPLYRGVLSEPEPGDGDAWTFTATGLHTQGDAFLAFDAALNASRVPDAAIDAAIGRGLPWARPSSLSATAFTPTDGTTGLSYLGPLLDDWAKSVTKRWGVDAYGNVYAAPDPTTPSWFMAPGSGRFGLTDDGYASDIYLRWGDGAGDYATAHAGSPDAAARFGTKELGEDYTDAGAFTSSIAASIAAGELSMGLPRLSWTNTVSPDRWQITDAGGSPAQLWLVRGGQMVRLQGVPDDQGRPVLSTDFVIGEATYDEDADTLTIAPVGMVSRSSVSDMLASLVEQSPTDVLQGIATGAQSAANAAQASADGKNTVWYTPYAPGGSHVVGDTWFDTDNDYQMSTWNGSAWVAFQLGTNAIADLSIVNAKIANATIQSAKVSYIDAGKVTVGTLYGIAISAVTISGSTITGSTLTTNAGATSYMNLNQNSIKFLSTGGSQQSIINLYDDLSTLAIATTGGTSLRLDGGNQDLVITTNGAIQLSPGSIYVVKSPSTYANTYTGTANVIVPNSAGQLLRAVSLREAKAAIEPLALDDVRPLLGLTPSTWFDMGMSERLAAYHDALADGTATDDDLDVIMPLTRIPGVVAEEVAKVCPVLATYDENGVLNGVAYDRIGPLLIPLVRELFARVEALEGARA